MTTIGLIGAGNIGSTVARLAVAAGHDVVLSNSRGPDTLEGLVADLGPHARAATVDDAASQGDIVVVTIPLRAYRQVPPAPLLGKVVIDTNNYYPQRDGAFEELDDGRTTSSALLQRHLAGAHVVKAFNNIAAGALLALARPARAGDRTGLPIAGDDESATATATRFLDEIGYDAVDAGLLADSWRFQPGTPAYGVVYSTDGDWSRPRSASVDDVRAALDQA